LPSGRGVAEVEGLTLLPEVVGFDFIHDPSILDQEGGSGVGTSRHYTVARRFAHSLQARQVSQEFEGS